MQSFWGEGGRSLKDHIGPQGGGQDGPKKDRIIFERSLMQATLPIQKMTLDHRGEEGRSRLAQKGSHDI